MQHIINNVQLFLKVYSYHEFLRNRSGETVETKEAGAGCDKKVYEPLQYLMWPKASDS